MKIATTNKKHRRIAWIDIAKAIAIILMVIGHECMNIRPIYVIIFSFHMPLFFILSGYTSGAVKDWQKFWMKSKKTFVKVWLLAVLMIVILAIETLIISHGSSLGLQLKAVLKGIFWGSNYPAKGINSVGVMWFLIVFFWAKLLFDFLQVFLNHRVAGIVLFVLAIGGYLVSQKTWLPQDMDIVPIAAFFMWTGAELKSLGFNAGSIKQHKFQLLFAGTTIFWLAMIAWKQNIDMSVRYYPHFILVILEAIAGTVFVCVIAQQMEKYHILTKPLSTIGQHTLAVMCIHHLDFYWIWWMNVVTVWWQAAICRFILDFFLLAIVIYIENKLHSKQA